MRQSTSLVLLPLTFHLGGDVAWSFLLGCGIVKTLLTTPQFCGTDWTGKYDCTMILIDALEQENQHEMTVHSDH